MDVETGLHLLESSALIDLETRSQSISGSRRFNDRYSVNESERSSLDGPGSLSGSVATNCLKSP